LLSLRQRSRLWRSSVLKEARPLPAASGSGRAAAGTGGLATAAAAAETLRADERRRPPCPTCAAADLELCTPGLASDMTTGCRKRQAWGLLFHRRTGMQRARLCMPCSLQSGGGWSAQMPSCHLIRSHAATCYCRQAGLHLHSAVLYQPTRRFQRIKSYFQQGMS
jgi:hypothetical protein